MILIGKNEPFIGLDVPFSVNTIDCKHEPKFRIPENMSKKFIIENDYLKYGDVELHAQLANNLGNVQAGGFWLIDSTTNRFLLFGRSTQFGHFTSEMIANVYRQGNYPKELAELNWIISSDEDPFVKRHLIDLL